MKRRTGQGGRWTAEWVAPSVRGGSTGAGRSRTTRSRATASLRRRRLILLCAAVVTSFLALGARCAHLQIFKASSFIERARSQQERAVVLDPHRGPILDRNGKELALSLAVDSVYADPSCLEDREVAARRLAKTLGIKTSVLRKRLDDDSHFVWIRRKITPDLRERIEGLELPGVGFVRESRRYYPNKTLASHVLGACGVDNQGLAGLEFRFDESIRGIPGRMLFLRDGRGGRVLDKSRTEAVPGTGLVLTLDTVIQHAAERELDIAMKSTSAKGAAVIVLQPRTGEILALASRPTFDPNNYSKARPEWRRNRAVSDYYEPGSTFKAITAAAALDAGVVVPDETIWCENGSITVARHRFREDSRPFGNLTYTEVLANSSNVGSIKVTGRLEPEVLHDAIRRFGFGVKTGVGLPAEGTGVVHDLSEWSGLSMASIAIGHEIGVTPLQLATAFGAVANDGVRVSPRIGRGKTEGSPHRGRLHLGDTKQRRVISVETARNLRRMLQAVVSKNGTGRRAAISGYSVGGKTGTTQKIENGRYSHQKHVAWFAGFAPVENPELVIVVMIDEPQGKRFHGGDVAAPVFARIAQPVLRYLGVPADRDGTLVFDRSVVSSVDTGPVSTERVASNRGFANMMRPLPRGADARGAGSGAATGGRTVQASILTVLGGARTVGPSSGGEATGDGSGGDSDVDSPVTMPDLKGMSLRQAFEAVASLGIACSTKRAGSRITRQDPRPGTTVRPDGMCLLTF